MEFKRTFKVDTLYHKFLKARNVPLEYLSELVLKLEEQKFIELIGSGERYSELEKLISRQNRDELFKLIYSIGNANNLKKAS